MKCLIPFFNLNQDVCTIQDFHEITITYSSKCHVFRVMSPDCKTFFFLPMRYIQLAPVIRLLLGLTRLDSCTLQCYTRAKTYKKTANTGEIRAPFGVNYDSSKRKVRVLHFFQSGILGKFNQKLTTIFISTYSYLQYINFTSDFKFHNRKHLQIVQYEDFHVLHLSGCS